MAKQLDIVAQDCMDLYYQQFKSKEDFFELSHFISLAASAYAKLLQEEYERSYRLSLQEKGVGEAQINPQWYIFEVLEVTDSDMGDKEVEMKSTPFTFSYDRQASGIQQIYQTKGRCGDFIRVGLDDLWKLKSAAMTDKVYWVPVANKVIFRNLRCGLKEVRVAYIPALSDRPEESLIADGMVADITTWVLQTMFTAKQGNVVDMRNNENPNKILETEVDKTFKKQ